ncbi:3'-5' exoribonuclease YhaM family protein [Paenibacillus sp. XY044]|uniref:3'-5' exoribonuclease YhaM family protein n=1 Tax=Paenibacillus sp. XY044 TaxID=2026089 RepID=UPI000B99381D|nr:HD domain-containing protein [Paenibacillus sp. XY044]OZB90548.1 phosphohydrolase [Paenibacillus sp. XY044]
MTLIQSFTEGQEITGFYLLKSLQVKQTNATPPKDYLDMILSDTSGEITAKLWDTSSTDKETFFAPMLVKVRGIVQLYRERLQFKVTQLRPAKDEDGYNITDFVRSAPVQPADLVYTIKAAAASIQDPELRNIIEHCYGKVGDKLMHYPAAKGMHHAFYAGLAYHVVRMLELAEFVCMQRPFLNRDLLVAGIILHDIAKTEELTAELGIVSEYSFTGKLIGHIPLAVSWITEAAVLHGMDLNAEKVVLLQHIILAHHNLAEWGSPVQPQIPEALALHLIDQMDAKLQAAEDAIDTMQSTDEWTIPVRALENKAFYRSKYGKA